MGHSKSEKEEEGGNTGILSDQSTEVPQVCHQKRETSPSASDRCRYKRHATRSSCRSQGVEAFHNQGKFHKYLDECDTLLSNKEVEDIMTSQPAVEGQRAKIHAEKLNLQKS